MLLLNGLIYFRETTANHFYLNLPKKQPIKIQYRCEKEIKFWFENYLKKILKYFYRNTQKLINILIQNVSIGNKRCENEIRVLK